MRALLIATVLTLTAGLLPVCADESVQKMPVSKDGAEMVYVPAGEFLMGSPDKVGRANEHPQHKVYLDGYWIYKYEVTVAQYRKFCEETGRNMPGAPRWKLQENHPIVNVLWEDAVAYAKWAGGSLPTEAQWEKAARGTDGREYPWGNDWDPAKCCTGVKWTTEPVGSYPAGASPYGAMDMAGNVWEWCQDWYAADYYKTSPEKNPQGPASGTYHVIKGGGWDLRDVFNRSAARCIDDYRYAYGRYGCGGIRVVFNESK